MKNSKVKKIVLTGLFTALLIVLQYITKPMGQLVTGACVNFVLIAAAMLAGLVPSIVVAVISPFFAYAFGIGPQLLPVVPAIAAGNLVLCLIYSLVFSNLGSNKVMSWIISIIFGAAVKFGVIYLLAVKTIIPMLGLPAQKATAMGAAFGITQMFTALLGGAAAFIIIPLIKKGIEQQ